MSRAPQYLEALTGVPKKRPFIVFDIESKDGNSQKAGFTRPFLVGFYDGIQYRPFRNLPIANTLHWYERCVSRSGCISQFMWHVLAPLIKDGPSRYAGYDIYAHNMGSFDGLFLPAWMERNNQSTSYKIMPVHGRIQAIEVWRFNKNRYRANPDARKRANTADRRKYGYTRILDSFRIMPASLDKIAKAFGLEGKLGDMDLNTHEDDPIWEKYNEIDCVQLYNVLKKYRELIYNDLNGDVGITAPSTAIKVLRRNDLPPDNKIARNIHFKDCTSEKSCDGCAHEFFRTAYFGGRTEVYQKKGRGWYYDVNSSYPFSMTKPAPTGDMFELDENEDFTRFAKDPNYIGFVRCTVDIPKMVYLPPLPVQHGGKLKFPTGRFSGTWDWAELCVLGRIGGQIVHVEKSVWIKGTPFLRGYVNRLYAMRKKGSPEYKGPALSEVAKNMLNSTFGKMGMDQNRIEMVILKPGEEQLEEWDLRKPGESDPHREKRKIAAQLGDHRFHIATPLPHESPEDFRKRSNAEKRGEFKKQWKTHDLPTASGIYEHDSLVRVRDTRIDAPYVIPQIAAHITSLSRILLWSFSMDILDRGFSIYYSDTDSIITNFPGYNDSKELGGLKKEFDGQQIEIESFAPKMYRLRKDTPFEGEHQRKNGKLTCEKGCPGCSHEKIMMKGFPKKYKTSETIEKLQLGEEIEYEQHEKLGALAKRGFRDTPKMQTVKKSLRSTYDKRIFTSDGNTSPVFFQSPEFLSARFLKVAQEPKYHAPKWLKAVVHLHDPQRPS